MNIIGVDKNIREAVMRRLDEINDSDVSRVFEAEDYGRFTNEYLSKHDLFADKTKAMKKLFAKNFDAFKKFNDLHGGVHHIHTIWNLTEMLFIEFNDVDFSKWDFLDRFFNGSGEYCYTHGVSEFMITLYHRDADEILQKFIEYPRAGRILLKPVLDAAVGSDGTLKSISACDGLIESVKSAGLEDSLRYAIFDAFLSNRNISTLAYFVKAVEDNKFTRFKSLKESMVHADIEYKLKFTSDEYIKIMRAVVDNDYEKLIYGKNGTHRLLTVHTLLKYRNAQFGQIAKKYIASGDSLVRRSFLYVIGMYDRYSPNAGMYYDIVIDNKFDDAEYAAFFDCFTYDGRRGIDGKMFDVILRVFDGMKKANFSVPSNDDFPITTTVSKATLADIMINIASDAGDKRMIAELEKRYELLPAQSRGNFVAELGDSSSLDVRALTVGLLKYDDYSCRQAYAKRRIKLTYDEAVRASDFLKSKNQDIKHAVLKEFMRSPDSARICEYLLGCKEGYKRDIGEEMSATLKGKVNKSALKASYSADGDYTGADRESVIALTRPDVKFPEYKKRPLAQIEPKRIRYVFDAINEFIERNKDVEYKPRFCSTLVTIGSTFNPVDYGNSFSRYPCGDQLEQIFKSLTPAEIAELYLLCNVFSDDPKAYEKCHKSGDAVRTFSALAKKYPEIECMYLRDILLLSVDLFVDEDTATEYVIELCLSGAFNSDIGQPRALWQAATSAQKDENITALIYLSDSDINPRSKTDIDGSYGARVFAKAYEHGLFSPEYIKYRLSKCDSTASCLTHRDDRNEDYMYSDGYKYPKFREFYKRTIDEFVNYELNRGTLKTPFTDFVHRLNEIYGAEIFVKAIVKLRGLTLVRNNCDYWFGTQKDDIISKILKTVRPAEDDTPEKFSALIDEYGVTDDELIRAAVYNLNFLNLVNGRLDIPGFKSAVLYFAAHLNENLNEARIEKIKEYSTIDYHDFKDGAFDFDWYADMIKTVPPRDFKRIYDNAKYITVAGLHKRAQRFFDALNGKISAAEAKARILESRNKDFCLIYSLIPLEGENDLFDRYAFFADFLKSSKKYGPQRQLSERRTVDIAFDNLARNAGYADSAVFIYEMESRDRRVIDMYDGVEISGYLLKLDCSGDKVKLAVTADGKKLSAVPSAIAKTEQATEIAEYKKTEEAKRKRLKRSLEEAMQDQTAFTRAQILNITAQPLIRSFFARLILTDGERAYILTDDGITDIVTGAPAQCDRFTIAHPVTLRQNGTLRSAMRYVIDRNIKQPFKQVFREMYIVSDGEKDAEDILCYKGFNVNLKKAVSALKSRGWGVSEDIGLRKVYYKSGTIAAIFREFDYYYIYDFGEDNRELESIVFIDRSDYSVKRARDVDPVVFSETLRDVDLMIAISANSTYDYELSMSTFEMRHAMIETIVGLLGINNVSFLKENVKVSGKLGTYVINIRTGLVFKEGKGNLLLKTIDNYDKPIALDFIDEDPMTADIVTKVLLLSDDGSIKDPAILDEIEN